MARARIVVRLTEEEAESLERFRERLDTAGPDVYVALAGPGCRDYRPIVSVLDKAIKARTREVDRHRRYREMPIEPMKAVR